MLEKIKNFKWGYVLITIVMAAIGVCFIAFQNALAVLSVSIGVLLAAFAIVFFVLTLSHKERGVGFALRIFLSVICLVGGIVTIVARDSTVDMLVALFSLLLIMDASFKLNTSAMSKRYDVVFWWVIMALSVITVIASFFLIKFTPAEASTASWILGVAMIIDAVNNFLSAFLITSFEKRMEDEIYFVKKSERE